MLAERWLWASFLTRSLNMLIGMEPWRSLKSRDNLVEFIFVILSYADSVCFFCPVTTCSLQLRFAPFAAPGASAWDRGWVSSLGQNELWSYAKQRCWLGAGAPHFPMPFSTGHFRCAFLHWIRSNGKIKSSDLWFALRSSDNTFQLQSWSTEHFSFLFLKFFLFFQRFCFRVQFSSPVVCCQLLKMAPSFHLLFVLHVQLWVYFFYRWRILSLVLIH